MNKKLHHIQELFEKISLFHVIWVVLLTFVATRVYFHAGFPYTHDGENHLARFANYKVAVKEGQFPPRFAPNLVNHYGYPVFNYNYPLGNILSLPFSFVKLSYEVTFKILAIGAVGFGIVGVFLWLKQLGFEKWEQVVGAVAFATAPYLIQTIYFRGNIGEILAMCLLPWLCHFIELTISSAPSHQPSWQSLTQKLFFAFLFAGFFLSHNIAVLFGTPLILIYAGFRFQKKLSEWKNFLFSFISGLLLSLWFWIPAIFEKSEVVLGDANLSQEFLKHFPTISQLLFSPLQFGYSYVGSIDSNPLQLGLPHFLILLFATIWLKKKFLNDRKEVQNYFIQYSAASFFVTVCWILLLAQLSFLAPLWQVIPFANFIQFPWRLTLFFSIFSVPVTAFFFRQSSTKVQALLWLLFGLQALIISRTKAVDYFHRDNLAYENFSQSTTTGNENLPKNFTYENTFDWQPKPSIIKGKGSIQINEWTGTSRRYALNLTGEAIIVEPTMYFPGWMTFSTIPERLAEFPGQKEQIEYIQTEDSKGRIAFRLSGGQHEIESKFTQNTFPRIIGNSISIIVALCLLCLSFFQIIQFVISKKKV